MFVSLSFQVVVPVPATVDFLFTPLPTRWKLCSFDRSRTTIEYVPAFTPWCRTAPPALRSEIVFFGPTVASSFGVGAAGGGFGVVVTGGGLPTVNFWNICVECGSHWTV